MSTTTLEPLSIITAREMRQAQTAKRWQRVLPYLLIFPTLLFVFVFTLWPSANAVLSSTIRPGPTVHIPDKFVEFRIIWTCSTRLPILGSRSRQFLVTQSCT